MVAESGKGTAAAFPCPQGPRRRQGAAVATPDPRTCRNPAQDCRRNPEKARPGGAYRAQHRGRLQRRRRRNGQAGGGRRHQHKRQSSATGSEVPRGPVPPTTPSGSRGKRRREPLPNGLKALRLHRDTVSSERPVRGRKLDSGHGSTSSRGRRRVTRRAEAKRSSGAAA